MKFIYSLIVALLFVSGCAEKTRNAKSKFIIDFEITKSVDDAVKIIGSNLKGKNYIITSTFDHEKEAKKLKEMLYPTKTINLYNSKISTKLISCNPTMALEIPFRVAIYSELNGKTHLTYTDPEYWSLKHNIKDKECLGLLIMLKSDLAEATKELQVKSK
jgi:uncharacterized protein (DUF302 family)